MSDERENNELADLREKQSSAESCFDACRLVRPGAACESRTDALRYRGLKCLHSVQKCGWYRGRLAFRPRFLGTRGFFYGLFPHSKFSTAAFRRVKEFES